MRHLKLYRLLIRLLPGKPRDFRLLRGEDAKAAERFAGIYRRCRARGAALGLFDREGVKTHLVYGEARPGMPVAGDTGFRTASVSKMVTALLVMKLAEIGRIGLDDDLEGILPYSLRHPGAPEQPVTLRMLLTHTAGIRDGSDYIRALGRDVPAERLLAGDSHTRQLPGEGCEYSNFGVGLAACALEAALGVSFEELAQDCLFRPLQMQASYYPHRLAAPLADAWRILPPGRTPAFDGKSRQETDREGWDRPDPHAHYSLAQGSCCMDMKSAVRLGQALMSPGFLSADSLRAMRAPAASLAHRDPALTQGIGTFLLRDKSVSPRPLYGHQGMAYGAVHMIFLDPEAGRGIISFTSGASEARAHILADLNKALIAAWQEER